jgi:hypothetical protein
VDRLRAACASPARRGGGLEPSFAPDSFGAHIMAIDFSVLSQNRFTAVTLLQAHPLRAGMHTVEAPR